MVLNPSIVKIIDATTEKDNLQVIKPNSSESEFSENQIENIPKNVYGVDW